MQILKHNHRIATYDQELQNLDPERQDPCDGEKT
jgi:hypothetical protein